MGVNGIDLGRQCIGGMPRTPGWPRKISGHKPNANANADAEIAAANNIVAPIFETVPV